MPYAAIKYLFPLERIAVGLLVISVLFRLMHWPYIATINALACAAMPVSTLLSFALKQRYTLLGLVRLILSTLLGLFIYYRLEHIPRPSWLIAGLLVVAATWFFLRSRAPKH